MFLLVKNCVSTSFYNNSDIVYCSNFTEKVLALLLINETKPQLETKKLFFFFS